MTTSQPNPLELAKQGNVRAIAFLMNRSLKPKGITAKAALKNDCLHLVLEASKPLNQQRTVEFVCKKINSLQLKTINKVKIYGRKVGEDIPVWQQAVELIKPTKPGESEVAQQEHFNHHVEINNTELENTSASKKDEQVDQVVWQSDRQINPEGEEIYHLYVGYDIASKGGTQKVTLRTGKTYRVNITSGILDSDKATLKKCGIQGNDIVIVLHTLYDKSLNNENIIPFLINNTKFEDNTSRKRCRSVYELVKDGEYTDDLAALDLLDFIVSSSGMDEKICQRYSLASQNSRLTGIEKFIEETLAASNLSEAEQQLLRGTYQCVKAGEAISDFEALNQLDSIVQNSLLPLNLKQKYSVSSATSRAITVELFIVNLIQTSSVLSESDKQKYLSIYIQVRDGEEVSDETTLAALDSLILNSDLPDDYKIIYKLARDRFFERDRESTDEDISKFFKKAADSIKKANNIVPAAIDVAKAFGIKAGTGAAISGLSGGAATNATLAALGGGSVAAGGLGMLGGLAVATGGAALIGAAALVSIASVSQMNTEDKVNLGMAAVAGTLTSAAAVGTAWAAVGAFGVAGTGTAISTLSGAAAYSSIMAALGGVGVMTGGAAFIAFGASFAAWKFLKGQKDNPQRIFQQLEARLYTLLEQSGHPLIGVIEGYIAGKDNVFIAPNIPPDKLSNALSQYAKVEEEEKVIALIDTTIRGSAKDGIAFTQKRVMWKAMWAEPDFIDYSDISSSKKELPKLYDENAEKLPKLFTELGKLYS
jgi:hypothetical protein